MSAARVEVAVLCLLLAAAGAEAAKASESILGTWRGTSTCVNREAAPACNDEQVVYEITAIPGAPDKVKNKADKIVNGERVPMGELEFTRESGGVWASEFETPRAHGRWELGARGIEMTGTLTLLPSKVVVRRVELKRDR